MAINLSTTDASAAPAAAFQSGSGERKDQFSSALAVIVIGAFTVVVFAILAYVWKMGFHLSSSSADWGVFGDYVGGAAGVILGFATLIALFVTVLLQRETLATARQQLADSKEEVRLTREESRRSASALTQQTFENTFFRMLEQFREFSLAIQFQPNPDVMSIYHGEHAWSRMVAKLKVDYSGGIDAKSAAVDAYEELYLFQSSWLGPYFRMLYHILRLVDSSQLTDDEKNLYASLARSRISRFEAVIIFYNLLSERSVGLRTLVVKYGTLKHLDRFDLVYPIHMEANFCVPESAFMGYEDRKRVRTDAESRVED